MSIDFVTSLFEGEITTSELDVLRVTQMFPSGPSSAAVGTWLSCVNDVTESVVFPDPSAIVRMTLRERVSITDTVS